MTNSEINGRMRYWQDRLNLKEWSLELHVVDELPRWETGSNRYDTNRKLSQIWISRKGVDLEWTIVHELVHLVLWYEIVTPSTELSDTLLEQTVNQITGALLERKEKTD